MLVLQLNIWARYGPYRDRELRLRRLFEELRPDLIGMQEVDLGRTGENQAAELLDGLGYAIVFEPFGNRRDQPGLAIAARKAIRRHATTTLPHGGHALAARINWGEEASWFATASHSETWVPGHAGEREEEAVSIDEWVSGLARDDTIPPILAADLDSTPEDASVRFLTGRQSLAGRSTYWADAFALVGDGSPGVTWTSESPYVQPFAEAIFAEPVHHRRIDYVFIGSPFRWRPRLVATACRVVGRYDGAAAPSDHYGVLAEIELDGDRVGSGRGQAGWDDAADELWPGHKAEAHRAQGGDSGAIE